MNLMINTLFANRYGLTAGLILSFFCENYSQIRIIQPKENFINGKYWSLMSDAAFAFWFTFISPKEIKTALETLAAYHAIEIKALKQNDQTLFAVRVPETVLIEGGY